MKMRCMQPWRGYMRDQMIGTLTKLKAAIRAHLQRCSHGALAHQSPCSLLDFCTSIHTLVQARLAP